MSGKFLIFGATGSIGSSLATQLKNAGISNVHLVARNEDEVKNLSNKLGYNYTIADVLKDGFVEKVNKDVNAMVVPGSGIVKMLAEKEGLDKVFVDSGFEWREAGCSMCLAMNPDKLNPQERCASTSNRNFEGRQGKDGRTHLVSPEMAAAAAIEGHFVDVRDWK